MKILQIIIYIFLFVLIVGSPLLAYLLLNKKKYKCDNSTGSCKQDYSGKYTTLKDCQNACVPPTKRYKCQKHESGFFSECIENSSGKYLYECQSDCGNYITFYFEDGTTETFPYSVVLVYFTKRGVETGCYDTFISQKRMDENLIFKMKNDYPPIKFNITSIPPGRYLFSSGYDWNLDPFSPNHSCNESTQQLQPGQDLKNLGPSDEISSKIWTNSFNYFSTKLVL